MHPSWSPFCTEDHWVHWQVTTNFPTTGYVGGGDSNPGPEMLEASVLSICINRMRVCPITCIKLLIILKRIFVKKYPDGLMILSNQND